MSAVPEIDFVHKPSKAALAYAKDQMGKAFKSNKVAAQGIMEDFDAGAEYGKQAASAWVPVSERMPSHDGPVLILAYSDAARTPVWRRVYVAQMAQFGWNAYMDDMEGYWDAEEVTHWQEQPALPKE